MSRDPKENYESILEPLEDPDFHPSFYNEDEGLQGIGPDSHMVWAKFGYMDSLEISHDHFDDQDLPVPIKEPPNPRQFPDPESRQKPSPIQPQKSTFRIGTLSLEERRAKIRRYLEKKRRRVWSRKIVYNCRKKVADTRIRVKGRFVTKEQALALQVPSL